MYKLLPPGKAYELLTGHLITRRSEPAMEKWLKSKHPYLGAFLVYLSGYLFQAHFRCHGISMLGRSHMKSFWLTWVVTYSNSFWVSWDPNVKKKPHKMEATSQHDHYC